MVPTPPTVLPHPRLCRFALTATGAGIGATFRRSPGHKRPSCLLASFACTRCLPRCLHCPHCFLLSPAGILSHIDSCSLARFAAMSCARGTAESVAVLISTFSSLPAFPLLLCLFVFFRLFPSWSFSLPRSLSCRLSFSRLSSFSVCGLILKPWPEVIALFLGRTSGLVTLHLLAPCGLRSFGRSGLASWKIRSGILASTGHRAFRIVGLCFFWFWTAVHCVFVF